MRKISWLLSFIVILSIFLLPGNLSTFKAEKLEEVTTDSKNNDFQLESHQTIDEEQELNSAIVSTEKSETDSSHLPILNQTEQKTDVLRSTKANVTNWHQFIRALVNNQVSTINITADILVPNRPRDGLEDVTRRNNTNVSGTSRYMHITPTNIARKVTIEGNGHLMDFGALSLLYDNSNLTGTTSGWHLIWKDLTIYHGNIYGFTTLNDLNTTNQGKSSITYHNIINYGSQLIHSPRTDVTISGTTKNMQVASYSTIFRNNWLTDGDRQINMYVTNLTLAEDAHFEMFSLRAGNILLGRSGDFLMKKNSTMVTKAAQNDLTGERDGEQTNLRIEGGNFVMEEGSELYLVPKPNYSAIALIGSNSQLSIGRKAKVFIAVNGHTSNANSDNRNIVRLSTGSKLTVAEEGLLDIRSHGMASSSSNIVHVDGVASFQVEKKGSFIVKSDSTSQSQSLLYFASANSSFAFRDAEVVDLERTAPFSGSGTSNGLINISGSGGKLDVDIQKVSLWQRNNFTADSNFHWSPMYGMSIMYSGTNANVQTASSLTPENITNFKAFFTTRNSQRVLFSHIPDVALMISSVATDKPSDSNSKTIVGTTNPGAYVRLSTTPVLSSIPPEIDPQSNQIKSPVTAEDDFDPLFTDNFTVIADKSGNYTYSLPPGRSFKAGTKITAYAFLDGKTDEQTQVVLDKTPPEGEGKTYHASLNEAVPKPESFVMNPKDSNPLEQEFTYAYSEENHLPIEEQMGILGEHIVAVDLFDEAGNSQSIDGTLIVHPESSQLEAVNVEMKDLELHEMSDEKLLEYLLRTSQAKSFKIVDGVITDLTPMIEISDWQGLSPTAEPGIYLLTLSVLKEHSELDKDLHQEIKVEVTQSRGTLQVNFLNEVGESLDSSLTIEGDLGELIDLTKHAEIIDILELLQEQNYLIVKRPPQEEAVEITLEERQLSYELTGHLFIKSAPTTIDFGDQTNSIFGTKLNQADFDSPLIIWDNRAELNHWQIYATLESPLQHQEDETKVLSDAIRYQNDFGNSDDIILNTEGSLIESRTHLLPGNIDISQGWAENKNGFKLAIPAGQIKKTGNYRAVILWQLATTP